MLTQERLKELLHYNPETGLFTRLIQRTNGGSGFIHSTGYVHIYIAGKTYAAHRLAWFYMTGEFPKHDIDHINGIKHDNRFCNLRDVPKCVNMQNERHARKHSSSKLMGATRHKNKFQSAIHINGKRVHLGTFNTAEEAHAAYIEAKRIHHLGCTI